MLKKRIKCFAFALVLLTACSNSDLSQQPITDINDGQDYLFLESKEKTNSTFDLLSKTDTECELLEIGYSTIEKETAKEGEVNYGEMGLYWDRTIVQRTFYPDVQEICEEAFGDYLSPLQEMTRILRPYDKRYRTDKQNAIVSSGRCEFYLFLQNAIALVNIEDHGETYYTSFRILRKEEMTGIRVLKVPPLGGIGIAGNEHKPKNANYDTHTEVTYEGEIKYTKADIQYVFDSNVQRLSEEIFGGYVEPLQGLYTLTEREGYGDIYFWIEDMPTYILEGYYETTIIGDNFCEFTLFLGAPDRARVTIKKEDNRFITTFRLLKDGEFPLKVRAG